MDEELKQDMKVLAIGLVRYILIEKTGLAWGLLDPEVHDEPFWTDALRAEASQYVDELCEAAVQAIQDK